MQGSFKSQLILHILKEHFGEITADVAKAIMNIEDCTLMSLCKHFNSKTSKLSINEIRSSLVSLIHHDCLITQVAPLLEDEVEIANAERLNLSGLIYLINEDMVINRLKCPIILSIANDLFGELSALIMEEMILKNRVRYQDVLTTFSVKSRNDGSNSFWTNKEIEDTFQKLVLRRLVVSTPDLEVSRRAKSKENKAAAILTAIRNDSASLRGQPTVGDGSTTSKPMTLKRKRTPKITEDNGFDLPMELRMIMRAEEQAKEAHVAGEEELKFDDEPARKVACAPNDRASSSTAPDRGRGRGRGSRGKGIIVKSSISSSSSFADTPAVNPVVQPTSAPISIPTFKDDVIWTIGWDQVIREERHSLCVTIARSRMGNLAGNIVRTILDSSMRTEYQAACDVSTPMSLHDIYDRVKSTENNLGSNKATIRPVDLAMVRGVIEFLRTDAVGIVERIQISTDDSNPTYFVRMKAIVDYAKRKLIHDVAVTRYDVQCGRIIELLQGPKKYIEEQILADYVILPARDVRERLYRMYKDKWVDFYELSKRNDFNPGSTYYFWYLDHSRLRQSILNNMYKAVLNLRLR